MKKFLLKFQNLLIGLFLSLMLVGCINKTPLAESQQSYAGRWVAADGTYVHIYLDGGGEFKASNSSVEGGAATITNESIKIGLGPISKTFQIDEPTGR